MNDSYIISFVNGSSGRFVKFILYSLLTDYKKEMRMNNENSAHLENFYTGSDEAHLLEAALDKNRDYESRKTTGESIYSLLEFDSSTTSEVPKIFQTHAYPEFEIIQNRLSTTKLILINLEEDDWLEAIGNTTYKNGIAILNRRDAGDQLNSHENDCILWLKTVYSRVLGVDLDLPFKYDIEETKKIIYYIYDLWKNHKIENITTSSFINPIADFKKYPNLTILNYKDLFKKTPGGSYVVLETLEKLTNTIANEQTFKNYEKYVNGRARMIEESMPWLLKEKPNN